MRIWVRLILGFLLISLLLAIFGYTAATISRHALENALGESSATLAQTALREVDHGIFKRIEFFESFSARTVIRQVLATSNQDFSKLPNIDDHILSIDKEWTAFPQDRLSPKMAELLNNSVATELRALEEYYAKKYGYPVIAEILITNKYGALIAQTDRATDYYQADEAWWQEAVKNAVFVDDVALDPSSGIYGISICLRVNDDEGNFLGVFKVVINIKEFGNVLEYVKAASDSQVSGVVNRNARYLECDLFTKNGKIIYSTEAYSPQDESSHWNFFINNSINRGGQPGYKVVRSPMLNNKTILLAYAQSRGFGNYNGLGWVLVFSYDAQDLLAPVDDLKKILLIVAFVSLLLSIFISFLIAHSIAKPIEALQGVALKMGEGDFDARVIIQSKDEIGILGQSLNSMAAKLKQITASRDELNAEIAERFRVEKELENEKNRAQQYLDIVGVVVIVLTKEGNIGLINDYGCEVLGYPKEQIIGKNWFDHFLPQKVVSQTKEVFARLMSGEDELFKYYENAIVTKKGEERIILWNNVALRDDDGKPIGYLSSGEDVTERRKAEKILSVQRDLAISLSSAVNLKEACESLLTALMKLQGCDAGGVYVFDERQQRANLIASRGLTGDFIDKIKYFDFNSMEVQLTKNGQPIYIDYDEPLPFLDAERRKEGLLAGAVIPFMDRGNFIGSFFIASHVLKHMNLSQRHTIEVLASSLGGIIARLKTEELLKESEYCFRSITEQTGQLVYDYDIITGSVQWSGAVEAVTGYSREEFRDMNFSDWVQRIHPEDRMATLEIFQAAMRESLPYNAQFRFRQKGGHYIQIEAHGIYLADKAGSPYRMVGIMSDITIRKEAEEMIRKSEEKYRVLVERANSVILRLDKTGRVMFLNEFGESFFGFTEEEILGKNAVGTIVPRSDDAGRDLEEMIKDICVHPERYEFNENQNVCKDGRKVWIAWTNKAIVNDKGESEVLCVGTDITARKAAEEMMTAMYKDLEKMHENLKETQNQLLQSEKMAVVGQLSAGVAHEVKNPLAIILLSVAALESQLKDLSEENKAHLKMISDAAERANKVVIQLLSFSRYAEVRFERQPLHHILENVLSLARMSFKEKAIEFHQEFINRELYVNVDKILIEQVFFNLIANAADSIVDAGKITIRTNVIELIDKKRKEVVVVIEDTGEGIPQEFRLKVFEPFFTTKELGKGTGLGLSVVYTILERHGGRVSFESETDQGTKFYVALPLLPEDETQDT